MDLDIVIPVLNEEVILESSINRLLRFCDMEMSLYEWKITIADNGSTDRTLEIARSIAHSDSRVTCTRLEERGRGRALKHSWLNSDADIVSYMDVDLSTGLDILPYTVSLVATGECNVAVGSRLLSGSEVLGRSFKRGLISRCYSILIRLMFFVAFKDAQCGFKVVSSKFVREALPLVRDTGWFFDTELLLVAEKNGYAICEVPVKWTDDPDSRVRIIRTAWEDIKGLIRMRFGGLSQARRKLLSRS